MCIRDRLHPHAIVLREKDMPEAEYLSLARDVIAPVSYTHLDVYKRQI